MSKTIEPEQTFNSWTTVRAVRKHGGRMYWLCRCKCGAEAEVASDNLLGNRSRSCRSCSMKKPEEEKSASHLREYRVWRRVVKDGCVEQWKKFAVVREWLQNNIPEGCVKRINADAPWGPKNAASTHGRAVAIIAKHTRKPKAAVLAWAEKATPAEIRQRVRDVSKRSA